MSAPAVRAAGKACVVSLSAASSATCVCTPAMPSTARRFLRWKSSTSAASSVSNRSLPSCIGGQAIDASQAVAQPAHARTARSERERLRAAGAWRATAARSRRTRLRDRSPMPISRCAPPRSTCAFSSSRPASTSWCDLPDGVDDVEHRRAIEQPQLRQRAALRQALEPRLLRLAAGIDLAGDVAQTPEREQLVEGVVGIGFACVLP